MSAESMLNAGILLSSGLILLGLAWGFILLKIQNSQAQ